MKAVATALVLIAGAAVVLWFGNTLNSWVLGGLIGGLAALLLSIPISLTLFSYLSRRHDERLKAEVEEELSLSQVYDYQEVPRIGRRVHEVESYMLEPAEEEWDGEEEEEYYPPQIHTARNLPSPSYQRLPAPDQGYQYQESGRLPAPQRGGRAPVPRQPTRNLPAARGRDTTRRNTARRLHYPGFPGYEPGSFRSQHQSAALRAARLEASQQYEDDIEEMSPTQFSRRPTARGGQQPGEYNERNAPQRFSQQLPAQPLNQPYRHRSRRMVDSTPSQSGLQRALPSEGETSAYTERYRDPETDYVENQYPENLYPQTGPVRRQSPTGQFARQTQREEQRQKLDSQQFDGTSGTMRKPLVRRAPYMYEDDPLRQELAQQIDVDAPIVRRSSRSLYRQDEEEE